MANLSNRATGGSNSDILRGGAPGVSGQKELFGAPAPESTFLKRLVLDGETDDSFSLSGAAEVAKLSMDTLRRSIHKGDLEATLEVVRGQEVYKILKSALSQYLMFRGLPRRKQEAVRAERLARALKRSAPNAAGEVPSPLYFSLQKRTSGRVGEDALMRATSVPTGLMRTGDNRIDPISPRAQAIQPSMYVAPQAPTSCEVRSDAPIEDRIFNLRGVAKRLEEDAARVRSELDGLLIEVLNGQRRG